MVKIREFLKTGGGKITLIVSIYVLYFLIMSFIGSLNLEHSTAVGIISLLVAVWGYFGWKSISFIQPKIFLIMPVVGWVVYFTIKAILGVLLGIFVLPYQIAKLILNTMER